MNSKLLSPSTKTRSQVRLSSVLTGKTTSASSQANEQTSVSCPLRKGEESFLQHPLVHIITLKSDRQWSSCGTSTGSDMHRIQEVRRTSFRFGLTLSRLKTTLQNGHAYSVNPSCLRLVVQLCTDNLNRHYRESAIINILQDNHISIHHDIYLTEEEIQNVPQEVKLRICVTENWCHFQRHRLNNYI